MRLWKGGVGLAVLRLRDAGVLMVASFDPARGVMAQMAAAAGAAAGAVAALGAALREAVGTAGRGRR